jgi:enamine deaminase RidA (YjgF/YER057c/UK114 family)
MTLSPEQPGKTARTTRRTKAMERGLLALGLMVGLVGCGGGDDSSAALAANCSAERLITVNPPTLLDPTPFGYKHITLDTSNGVAYVAGQVAFSLAGAIVGSTLAEQLVLVEENLRFALGALDADVEDILRMNTFVTNFRQDPDLATLEPFLFRMGSPVNAVLGVPSLAIDGLLVEVQITVAVTPATVEKIRCRNNA